VRWVSLLMMSNSIRSHGPAWPGVFVTSGWRGCWWQRACGVLIPGRAAASTCEVSARSCKPAWPLVGLAWAAVCVWCFILSRAAASTCEVGLSLIESVPHESQACLASFTTSGWRGCGCWWQRARGLRIPGRAAASTCEVGLSVDDV
jgi:hypothetical protein